MERDLSLSTERFQLVPIARSDASDIERLIFSDPEVVKGLASNTSTPQRIVEETHRWCDRGPSGSPSVWAQLGMGFYTVRDRTGVFGEGGAVLGAVGLKLDNFNQSNGELIYAYGAAFHGAGIATEAAIAITDEFFSRAKNGVLVAHYWHLLNPASANVLKKSKFRDDGFVSPLEDFGEERAADIRNFEIWRLQQADSQQVERIATEAAIKLGHLARDGISTVDQCIADLLAALPSSVANSKYNALIAEGVGRGVGAIGLARVRRDLE